MLEREVIFELCAETLEACLAATPGGADRIELCVDLAHDGLTPPDDLIRDAVRESSLPVHVLVRPGADDFRYSPRIFEAIRESAMRAGDLGAAGVVLGLLRDDRTVDVEHTRELVELLRPLPVDFHRAFDRTPNLSKALEDVIACGCVRVLTSGGAPDVIAGVAVLDSLHAQAAGRIEAAAGGGLRLHNARQLAAGWRGRQYHGSLGGTAVVDGRTLVERIEAVRRELAS